MTVPPAEVAGVVLRYLEDNNLAACAALFRREAMTLLQQRSGNAPVVLHAMSLQRILSDYVQLTTSGNCSHHLAQQLHPAIVNLLKLVEQHSFPGYGISQHANVGKLQAFHRPVGSHLVPTAHQPASQGCKGMGLRSQQHQCQHQQQAGVSQHAEVSPARSTPALHTLSPPAGSNAQGALAALSPSDHGVSQPQGTSHRNKRTPKKRRLQAPDHRMHGLPEGLEGDALAGVLGRALNPQSMMSLLEAGDLQDRFAAG
eukprot:CAMPEP_0206147716 /NCGR_PEP_ID=MMETSP1473-20131121/34342_1 /ASSEMBLY_ACC=CAM_ASM_001109 /TAXON_ID=1461547 /ORGANISM="Stichococcus sp, Strain RCC1054" /LENGTH=256 /DNA_ID=CAMNT_0053544781 /DNA_START=226 /DNA_END=993 /DNA_ORIENTATION=-